MTEIMVQNLDDDLHRKLSDMAIRHGQTLEEFVCQTLRKAVSEQPTTSQMLGSRIAKRFAEIGLQEPVAEIRGRSITPSSFE